MSSETHVSINGMPFQVVEYIGAKNCNGTTVNVMTVRDGVKTEIACTVPCSGVVEWWNDVWGRGEKG